jgi:hypothetical protein
MDQHYDSDDDGSAGDDVPGREAYDFTNAELARNLDDSVPISYVIFKLIKAAPGFWKNSRTANCVLSKLALKMRMTGPTTHRLYLWW